MEKKIEDYLHLYLGCDCEIAVIVPGQELSWEPDKLNIRWLHGCLNKLVEVKPILRPLTDIAEKEIYKVVSIMLGKEVDFLVIEITDDKDFIIARYKDEKSVLPGYDRIQMELHISNIGNAFRVDNCWNYIKNGNIGVTHEILHNSHEITRYLLSCGFDIFGLIEEGLAINASKTIPECQ